MPRKSVTVLAINPGSKYLGLAILEGSDLKYWGIKVLRGRYSEEKIDKVKAILSDFISQYDSNVLAIKKLHQSRSSRNLNDFVRKIIQFSRRKGLKIYQYTLKDLVNLFSPGLRINKRQVAKLVVSQYPFLARESEREERNKNPYFIRMFEAIALGMVCFEELKN